jgi:AcrR family transcriptional regulator
MKRAEGKTAMSERILDTADRLFYGRGIRVVGVDAIAEQVGISMRALHNYFPSKDDLIVAYLERRASQKSRGPPRLHRWGSMNSPFFLVCDDDVTELI